MVNPPDEFDERHRVLTEILLMKLAEQQDENAEYNRSVDLETYRQSLAESNPALSHWMEQRTVEERQELLKEVTLAESVAYAILWALDNFSDQS